LNLLLTLGAEGIVSGEPLSDNGHSNRHPRRKSTAIIGPVEESAVSDRQPKQRPPEAVHIPDIPSKSALLRLPRNWGRSGFESFIMPLIKRVVTPSLIDMLVNVQPMAEPNNAVMYMDYVCTNKPTD
jgi:hypothetical protein